MLVEMSKNFVQRSEFPYKFSEAEINDQLVKFCCEIGENIETVANANYWNETNFLWVFQLLRRVKNRLSWDETLDKILDRFFDAFEKIGRNDITLRCKKLLTE